jgi:hypothetical protein
MSDDTQNADSKGTSPGVFVPAEELPKPIYQLCEVVADIAFIAGAQKYHSGDSREDCRNFILWAQEFEAIHATTEWDTGSADYIADVQKFAEQKLESVASEACDVIQTPTPGSSLWNVLAEVEAAHFRTINDTGAADQARVVWNALRRRLGLPEVGKYHLPQWDGEKYAMPADSALLANVAKSAEPK